MPHLHRILVLLFIGVLGFQTGAMAAHMHFTPVPVMGDQAALSDPATHAESHHDAASSDSHHSTSCASAESCFPTATAAGVPRSVAKLTPASPLPLRTDALPASRPDRLLRPPRLLG